MKGMKDAEAPVTGLHERTYSATSKISYGTCSGTRQGVHGTPCSEVQK